MAEENALPRTQSGQIVQPINMSAQSNQPTAVNIPQQQAQPAPYIPSNADLQTPAMLDMQIVQQLQEKANTNNKLLDQINGLTTALSKGTLAPETQNNLTPQQMRAIQVGDMNSIAQQIGMVKWTMSARGQEVKESIGYLLNGMQQVRQEQESKRISARQNIMDALNIMGSGAFEGLSGDDKRKLEKNSGLTNGYLDRATGALQENERKAEEARQLQMEQSRQSMRLQEEQFRFSKEQAAADERFRQQQFAFQQAEAGRARSASAAASKVDPIATAKASFDEELRSGKVSGKNIASTAAEEKLFAAKEGFVTREQAKQYFKNVYGKYIDGGDIDIAIDQRFMTEEERKIRGK
jgi:hypothetical protein